MAIGIAAPIIGGILKGIGLARQRRTKEDQERDKEERQLERELKKLRASGEETRKTQKEKFKREAPFRTRPTTFADVQRPVSETFGAPAENVLGLPPGQVATPGPAGGFVTGRGETAPEQELGTSRFLQGLGLQIPQQVTGEGQFVLPEGLPEVSQKPFKPFQLTPETEAQLKTRIQEGLDALSSGEINPSTGQPVTAQEIFRLLSGEFPGQANRLKTIILSGRESGEPESLQDLIFE
ncbi:hypothetical protein LCGC14_2114950 [marine sediment metagenome]|uniref:Uncharacterized protein n=1 Tax=marine sediment metagenome TaxID=412755 RepID=A0A0F9H2A2_9ZZZZ